MLRVEADHRRLLRAALLLLTAILLLQMLQGCGWRFRGSVNVAVDLPPLYVDDRTGSRELRIQLDRILTAAKITRVTRRDEAGLVLKFYREESERRVMMVDAAGKVSDYELRYTLEYQVFSPDGEPLTDKRKLMRQRDYEFNPEDVLAKDREERKLFEYIRGNVLQNVLRGLRGVMLKQKSDAEPESEPEPDTGEADAG